MTKKLEELFGLPSSGSPGPSIDLAKSVESIPSLNETMAGIDKIEAALPAVKGLEASDSEMDDLAKKAVDSYDNLMDLGMNVDSRYASEIFGVASQMLGHAITAKTAKINKKIKMLDLQLRKAGLDQKIAGKTEEVESTPLGEGQTLDRNELLKMLAKKTNE